MKRKDPTRTDIIKVLKTLGVDLETRAWLVYNDKRGDQRRRFKLPVALDHSQHARLQEKLEKMFPAHSFCVGHHFWKIRWFGDSYNDRAGKRVTTIHVHRDNALYDELFPEIKEMTLEEVAKLAGVPVSCLRIKEK